ncbi:hypothetical protein GPECTOR_421g279 [Gonium pectorale]|uniref:Methyltransferase type 12 domain-containing protein n=1 Tax=Gonium pectorale TaxID=33097 RepID=A0A150FV63_GONPE|nr:hypothetical protein GPECTOR_421g279 [Gonium pectorale]|eukprot:KXZ41511.1 hypothetical protein GPECTOR_421g279 [Gonium pectorale]
MVEQAARRGCYSRLEVAELVDFLRREADAVEAAAASSEPAIHPYDLLVAADVFVYIGDLGPVLAAAAAAAAPGAVLAFSTEALERAPGGKANRSPPAASEPSAAALAVGGSGGCPGLRLQVTGRYAHSLRYLEDTGRRCGWDLVSSDQSVIRQNGGEPIWGHLCVMRRVGGGRGQAG